MIATQASSTQTKEITEIFDIKTEIISISILSLITLLMVLLLIFQNSFLAKSNNFNFGKKYINTPMQNQNTRYIVLAIICTIAAYSLSITMQNAANICTYYKRNILFKIFNFIYEVLNILTNIMFWIIACTIVCLLFSKLANGNNNKDNIGSQVIYGQQDYSKEQQEANKFPGKGIKLSEV